MVHLLLRLRPSHQWLTSCPTILTQKKLSGSLLKHLHYTSQWFTIGYSTSPGQSLSSNNCPHVSRTGSWSDKYSASSNDLDVASYYLTLGYVCVLPYYIPPSGLAIATPTTSATQYYQATNLVLMCLMTTYHSVNLTITVDLTFHWLERHSALLFESVIQPLLTPLVNSFSTC